MNRKRILALGGARGGKSQFAQDLAHQTSERVLFVATAEPLDEEMRRRIDIHRASRPQHWRTLEAFVDVGTSIRGVLGDADLVVIDCITLLVSNILTGRYIDVEGTDYAALEKQVVDEIEALVNCMEETAASFIVVSNEVGMGLVPGSPLERSYRDALGRANQILAQYVDEVYLLVAGIPVTIKDRRHRP